MHPCIDLAFTMIKHKSSLSAHCHYSIVELAIVVLRMVIITARSLHTGCDTGLVKVRVPLCPPCPHLTTSSLSPSGATIQTWHLYIQVETLSPVYLVRDIHCSVVACAQDDMTTYSPLTTLHSARCTLQVTAGCDWAGWHSLDSSLTRVFTSDYI